MRMYKDAERKNNILVAQPKAEETIGSFDSKIASIGKTRHCVETGLEDLSMQHERTHAAVIITKKRAANSDNILGVWKAIADDMMVELGTCRNEGHNYNSEVYCIKAAKKGIIEHLEVVHRGNRNLEDETKDFLDQIEDRECSIHELDK